MKIGTKKNTKIKKVNLQQFLFKLKIIFDISTIVNLNIYFFRIYNYCILNLTAVTLKNDK